MACRTLCLTWMGELGGTRAARPGSAGVSRKYWVVGDALQEVLMFAQKHDGEHGSQTLTVQIDSQQELKR